MNYWKTLNNKKYLKMEKRKDRKEKTKEGKVDRILL